MFEKPRFWAKNHRRKCFLRALHWGTESKPLPQFGVRCVLICYVLNMLRWIRLFWELSMLHSNEGHSSIRCLRHLSVLGLFSISNSQSSVCFSLGMVLSTPKWSWLSAKHHPSTSSSSCSHWSCHRDESKSKPNEFNWRCLRWGHPKR